MSQPYSLSPNELTLWLNYIEQELGFVLPASQNSWVQNAIERYLRERQMDSTQLLAALMQDTTLYHQLMDDILIPRTAFFRHLPSFSFVESYARQWQHQHYIAKGVTVLTQIPALTAWSVGCATGQEAISLGLSLYRSLGSQANFRVYGSDFHQQALQIAKLGQYDMSQLSQIPAAYHTSLVLGSALPSSVNERRQFSLKPALAKHLQYFSYNLKQFFLLLPIAKHSCHILMCNNVLIYFRQFEQRDIINHLLQYLAPEGILLLGVGELPQLQHPQLRRLAYPQINGYCHADAPEWLQQLVI